MIAMSKYELYYEIPAKKYRVSVIADNLADAQEQGKEKIIGRIQAQLIFIKCERRPEKSDIFDNLKDIFGIFAGK
jgi:hypothetical protein